MINIYLIIVDSGYQSNILKGIDGHIIIFFGFLIV